MFLKRKTPLKAGEKKTLSQTENEPVVRIPLVIRIGPIVVQPPLITITVHVEHIQIAIAVGYVQKIIRVTASLIDFNLKDRAVFYSRSLKID